MGFFKKLYAGFKAFGTLVSSIVNYVVLAIVYIIGIGLTSIITKLFGMKFLLLKKLHADSYWIDHKITKKKLSEYYRSF